MSPGLHPRLQIEWLGRVRYGDALDRQKALVEERRAGLVADRMLLLEHPPVITLGRSARAENVRTPIPELQARGVDVHEVARGGDVTYHGPGQLVGYLIADLEARGAADVTRWLRGIESALIEALAGLGVPARRIEGMTGVYVDDAGSETPRKIASIGVGLRGWVTYHGFALNATMDLAEFEDIVPCGLQGVTMTSVAHELGQTPGAELFERCKAKVADAFAEQLG
jgi:lipoyl(octanoyl) transferase